MAVPTDPWPTLAVLLRAHAGALLRSALWLVLLAAATGLYGLLAGPTLRLLFGGAPLAAGVTGPGWPAGLDAGWLPAALVGVALVKALATRQQAVAQARLGLAAAAHVRRRAHAALLDGPPELVSKLGAGDALLRLTEDAERVEALVSGAVLGFARDALQVLVLVGLCLALDPTLSLLFFGVYPLAIVPMAALGRRLRRAAARTLAERGALATDLHQQLQQLPLLQAAGAEGWATDRLTRATRALDAATLRAVRLRATASPLMEVLGAVALATTVIYARHRIEAGTLSPDAVLSFLTAALLLYAPVKGLTRLNEVLAPGLAALARLAALGTEPAAERPGALPPPRDPPEIRLSGVIVHGRGQRPLALPDLRLAPGRLVAVLGANGTGKSTLAGVVMGHLVPAAGEVLVNGCPLPMYDRRAWRRTVGWVPQASLLTRGSVRENVALGRTEADGPALEAAAVRAGLEPVLDRLPHGWETPLADGGEGLSGGEQRRVALARALLGGAPVLVLDEPETNLDTEAVVSLAATLRDLARDHTVLLLTHDPDLAAAADTRVVLGTDPPMAETCSPSAFAG